MIIPPLEGSRQDIIYPYFVVDGRDYYSGKSKKALPVVLVVLSFQCFGALEGNFLPLSD